MKNLLRVNHLHKRYLGKAHEALRGVSFGVKTGELLVLVGESGSGKTTLLKVLAGQEDADAGEVLLRGEAIPGPSGKLVPGHPEIKLVFQDYHLFPNYTVYQNLEQALKGYQRGYQTRRIKELLALCTMEPLRDKYPRELSGGEQQRVALARALADEPPVLLLDEPFSNLDELTKQPLKRAILESVHTLGTAAVLVTHDSHDALSMADRLGVMQRGRMLQLDTPQTIYQRPVSPYVARFWGNANILTAQQVSQLRGRTNEMLGNVTGEVCIRAENIGIVAPADADFRATVTRVRFAGLHDEVTVLATHAIELLLYAPVGRVKIGEELPLGIATNGIHTFAS